MGHCLGKKDTGVEVVADQSADRRRASRSRVWLDTWREEWDVSPSRNGDGEGETGKKQEEGGGWGERRERDKQMCPSGRSTARSILSVNK